ncbi:MAG TPA: hypothetical protein VHV55_26515 [Pirellulales bacterium]|jgi:DNA-directed RNA polymerase specialized sigma24 family protein|nr:hypothetical protein [Pirellulales bacterium]
MVDESNPLGERYGAWSPMSGRLRIREFAKGFDVEAEEAVEWVLEVIEKIGRGATWEEAVDREISDELVYYFAVSASEVFSSCGAQWKAAATIVARDIPAITRQALNLIGRALPSDNFDHHALAAEMARVLGPRVAELAGDLKTLAGNNAQRRRLVALYTIIAVQPPDAVEELIEHLADPSEVNQFLAAEALIPYGGAALSATPYLLTRLNSPNRFVRSVAMAAIRLITVERPGEIPSALWCEILTAVRRMFHDDDAITRSIAVEFIRFFSPDDESLLPTLVGVWQMSRVPAATFGDNLLWQDCLSEMVSELIPVTDDEAFDGFFLKFLLSAFHPDGSDGVAQLASDPWCKKVQLKQLRRTLGDSASVRAPDLLEDATQEFAVKLLKNPTLGMSPNRCRELPGFIRNHARDVAKVVYRQFLKGSYMGGAVVHEESRASSDVEQPPNQAMIAEVREQFAKAFHEQLSLEERETLRCRLVSGMTLNDTAANLSMTVWEVRNHTDTALEKLAAGLGLTLDKSQRAELAELLAAETCGSSGPGPESQG